MARLKPGDPLPPIRISDIHGRPVDPAELLGKRWMLSFYRYAECIFCTLRLSQLDREDSLADLPQLAVFQSPVKEVQRQLQKHPRQRQRIIADPSWSMYKAFGIERSYWRFLLGSMNLVGMWKALRAGIGIIIGSGPIHTVPADFLIDESGRIHTAYYGRNISDHLPMHIVQAFQQEGK